MKIIIEKTAANAILDSGAACMVFRGYDDHGRRVKVYVARLEVALEGKAPDGLERTTRESQARTDRSTN